MKYSIASSYLIMFILLFHSSCKNGGGLNKSIDTANIVGAWELRQEQNGMIPAKNHAPGNGNIFKFSAAGYEQFSKGDNIKRGEYAVVIDSMAGEELGLAIPAGQFTNRIIFDNDSSSAKIFFEITNDSLVFLSGYFPTDGGSRSVYIKQ